MTAVLDHLAIGTPALTDGWDLFGGVLGGTLGLRRRLAGVLVGPAQSSPRGPKIELLTPAGGPDAAFLERFLAAHGPGAHHLTFVVPDIEQMLARMRAFGIEPVGVNLANPSWKEAFLHPRSAHGIVVQVAQQAGRRRTRPRRASFPRPGRPPAST